MAVKQLSFSIVEFDDGIELLPTKWLDLKGMQAYWPKFKDSRDFMRAVEREVDPDKQKWNLYPLKRVMYQTDSHEKGRSKVRQAEQLSDLGTENEEVPVKRRCFPSLRVRSDSESDSDSSSAASVRKTKATNKILPSFPPVPVTGRGEQAEQQNVNRKSEGDQGQILRYLQTLVKNQSEMKIKLNAIQEAVTDILKRLNGLEGGSPNVELHDMGEIFPISSVEDLTELEKRLKEKNFESSLIADLSTYGGSDAKGIVLNILRRCFSNEIANMFSWEGRKQKEAFSTLGFTKVIFLVVRKHIKYATNDEISSHIKQWLRLTKLRLDREREKSNRMPSSSTEPNIRSPSLEEDS